MIARDYDGLTEPHTLPRGIPETFHRSILAEDLPQNSSASYMNQLAKFHPTLHVQTIDSWKCNVRGVSKKNVHTDVSQINVPSFPT